MVELEQSAEVRRLAAALAARQTPDFEEWESLMLQADRRGGAGVLGIRLKDSLHARVEPLEPMLGGHIPQGLAPGVLVAGGGAVVTVLVVEALAGQDPLARFGIQMFDGEVRRQGCQQPAATDHPLESQEGVLLVEFQTQVGGQDEPAGDFLLFAGRGHGAGHGGQNLRAFSHCLNRSA
jgi:hypothetical protein